MLKVLKKILVLSVLIVVSQSATAKETDLTREPIVTDLAQQVPSTMQVTKNLASMPLSFTENQGQWDDKVKFRANAGGATMWFASDGAYYQFTRTIEPDPISVVDKRYDIPDDMIDRQPDSIETMMIKANFVGANLNPLMVGVEMIDYKCNYFIGNDKSKWVTDVPNYTAVMYEKIYNGIDLKYYGNGTHMEYDFIVEPGADFSQIKIQYEGAESIAVNDNGELVVTTKWGEVVEQRPVIYQVENNSRIAINGKYLLEDKNSFSFKINNYNPDLPLVIDPVLSYSTYLGGSGNDEGFDIAVDDSGAAYLTGDISSTDFPTLNPYQETIQGGYDVFVTKLSSSGNSLVYSTYLGGSDNDFGNGIAVDAFGAAYVTGFIFSSNFPTLNPYNGTYQSDADVFVTKLSSSGNSLVYSTYLGGSGADNSNGIVVDASGAAYVTGGTGSTDFPTQNPYSATNQGSADVFVTKLSSSGDSLVYSTFLGGSGNDNGNGIVVDAFGAAYVTGGTTSTDFPTLNPYQGTNQGGRDIFVTKLSSSGDSLVYSTYLGGSGNDEGFGIVVDASGAAYVTGFTYSTNFPTLNSYSATNQGSSDVFVTKLSSSGNSLVYSTYLGGSDEDECYSIAVNASGAAYVTGLTASTDFPTLNPYRGTNQGGSYDVFVTKLEPFSLSSCCVPPIRGNVDADVGDEIDISDLVFLVAYMFQGGTEPPCLDEANIDGSTVIPLIDISDLVGLVAYMFQGGPEPTACL